MPTRQLELWFSYGSTYTYLTIMRIGPLVEANQIDLVWRPFNLITYFQRLNSFPFENRPERIAYMWRDIERRARRYGIEYKKSLRWPMDTQRVVRVGYLAAMEGWCDVFTHRAFETNFLEQKPLEDEGVLEGILQDIDRDPKQTIARAHEQDIEEGLAQSTEKAINDGLFGSPNFVVDGELFWGDDRLEDAIEWAVEHTGTGSG